MNWKRVGKLVVNGLLILTSLGAFILGVLALRFKYFPEAAAYFSLAAVLEISRKRK